MDKCMNLEVLCAEWLKNNFNMVVHIRNATVLDQKEIDKALNLVAVECDFNNENGEEGLTVAFLDADKVPRTGAETRFHPFPQRLMTGG